MTDSKEPDHIGEVIAEDVAKPQKRASILKETDVSYAANAAPLVQRFWCHEARNIKCVRASDYDELRQRLADVSNERDVEAARHNDVLLCFGMMRDERDDLQLRLNASGTRNAELTELVRKIQVRLEAYVGDEAEMSMNSMRLTLAYANEALFAQSAPATEDENHVD